MTAAFVLLAGCARENNSVRLVAPFDEHAGLGEVVAAWRNTGEERAFAGGTRLKQAEVRFQYRADVRNNAGDRLFVRLADFQLVGSDGLALASDFAAVGCTLNAGVTEAVLAGEVWLPQSQADAVRGFHVAHLAVPLGQRGLARYREWLLQSRPGHTAGIDIELAQYAAAPPCAQR
ncbi:MAG TPA: hypothetical protein VL403_10600 [Candidatus Kryptonia bacterium]|nr:hypothetical protein [Candidatus Kryptonia bacterium]